MKITRKVKNILDNYLGENPGIVSNLCKILMHGRLSGTGNMLILPVDQGFEHGPARSFAPNPDAYDPDYHIKLAIDARLNAYAAPIGMLEAVSMKYAGQIPTILKMNSGNSMLPSGDSPDQAVTSSAKDALSLGCSAIGLTIYPGSKKFLEMLEEAREIIAEAKSYGLAVVIWSYPRGERLSKKGETAIDVCAYAAHMAALIGAHIIKVKLPTDYIENEEAKKFYQVNNVKIGSLTERVAHVVQSCFNGKRLVIFSGGGKKSENELMNDISAIRDGGGNGSIIGRNSFQRPYSDAISLLKNICDVYKESPLDAATTIYSEK